MTSNGVCDTHVHFYDRRFPSAPSALIHPPDATPQDYQRVKAELGLERIVIVQPTTYGLDNRCQLEAAAGFGDAARTIVVVDDTIDDHELRRLTDLGVRGARFHMLPGGAVPWEILPTVADRIAPFGWHIQLQLDGNELADRIDQLIHLPVDVVVDHIGRFMPPVTTTHPSFRALLHLLDSRRGWVKLSAPYESSRSGPADHVDLDPLIENLVASAPDRVLWATNWPHPGRTDPPTPDDLARLRRRWLPDPTIREQVLVTNPAALYGFPSNESKEFP